MTPRIKNARQWPKLLILFVSFNLSLSVQFTRFQRYTILSVRRTGPCKTIENTPLISCSVLCHDDRDCKSINYRVPTKTCEMNGNQESIELVLEQNWYLYSSAQSGCVIGWVTFLDSCYLFENKRKAHWHAAWEECAILNAHLVKIESEIENAFIQAELQRLNPGLTTNDQFFTAGNDLGVENEWVWAGTKDNSTEFTNGEVIEFSNWYDGEPNNEEGDENCMAFFPGFDYKWNDASCDELFHFICEKKNE